jgi:O-antigen/teichoic acid export membrane protein
MKAVLQVFSFDVVGKALLAVMTLLLIRYMAAEQFAQYTLALALVAVVSQTLTSTFNRIYIVGHRDLRLGSDFAAFLGLQLLTVAASWLLLAPFRPRAESVFWLALAVTLGACMVELGKTVLQEEHKFLPFSLVELLRAALVTLTAVALIWVLRQRVQAWQVLAAQAVVLMSVFAVVFRRRLHLRDIVAIHRARDLALRMVRGEYRFLFIYFALVALLSQTGVFALKFLSSDQELASFGAAFRYYTLLSLALNAVHVVLLPLVQHGQSRQVLDEVFGQQRKALAVFAPAVVAGMLLAQWALPWIDHGKYPEAVGVFQILSLSAIVSFSFSPHVNLILRYDQFRFLCLLTLLAIALHVFLAYAFVSRWGAVGAAWSATAAFAVLNGWIYVRATSLRRAYADLGGEEALVSTASVP